jgi:hypothetical protein
MLEYNEARWAHKLGGLGIEELLLQGIRIHSKIGLEVEVVLAVVRMQVVKVQDQVASRLVVHEAQAACCRDLADFSVGGHILDVCCFVQP